MSKCCLGRAGASAPILETWIGAGTEQRARGPRGGRAAAGGGPRERVGAHACRPPARRSLRFAARAWRRPPWGQVRGRRAPGRRRPRGSLRRPRVLPRQVVRRRRLPQTRAAGPRARPSRGARSGATAASAAEGRVRLAGETAPGPGGRCPGRSPRPRAGRKRKPPAGPKGRSQGLAGGGGGALWPAEARDLVRAKVDLTGCQPGSPPPPSSGSPAGPQGPRGRPLSPPRPPIGPLPFADSPSHWSPGLAPRLGVPLARSPPPRPPVGLAPCPSQSLGTTSGCPRRGLVIPASSAGACLGFALSLSFFTHLQHQVVLGGLPSEY